MDVTIPTELNTVLEKDKKIKAIFKKLSDGAKRSYANYIISARTRKDRICRANHAAKMLIGQAQQMNARC